MTSRLALAALAGAVVFAGCGGDKSATPAQRSESGTTAQRTTAAAAGRGGPGRVVQDYWEGARKKDAVRFCPTVAAMVGDQAVDLPRKACSDAFRRGAPTKGFPVGEFDRVISTKIHGSKATVEFTVKAKSGKRTRQVSLVKTPRGWKVLL